CAPQHQLASILPAIFSHYSVYRTTSAHRDLHPFPTRRSSDLKFWQVPGVFTTAAGYAGGGTPNPTYREVCSGRTGHAEVVRVVYDPAQVDFATLLKVFWESHDPTQGMRQGNDVGTQYRSVVHCHTAAQHVAARASLEAYQASLRGAGYPPITTEVVYPAPPFYYAE